MAYTLEIREGLDKTLIDLSQNRQTQVKDYLRILNQKVMEILYEPYQFRRFRKPLQDKRRAHLLGGSFVLIYSIDETRKTIILEHHAHHDDVYKF